MVADGTATARTETPCQLPHGGFAELGQCRQRRCRLNLPQQLVDQPQTPRSKPPRCGTLIDRGAVTAELNRDLRTNQLHEHFAGEARMAHFLRQAQKQASDMRIRNVEDRCQSSVSPFQVLLEPGAHLLSMHVTDERALAATAITACLQCLPGR